MSVAVLIPWRPGCSHRERALAWVLSRLAEHRWPVVIGTHTDGAWNKAKAIHNALAQTDAEVLIVHDADVLCDALPEAVAAIPERAPWSIPHRAVFRLTEAATDAYKANGSLEGLATVERPYSGVEGGGIVVLHRNVWNMVPIDPRFAGWGSEDEAWGWALRALIGAPWRGKGQLAHLWHEPQERTSRARGSVESQALRKRYAHALRHESQMAALIKEAKACH